jgi:SOS response regulatory protein OraA/RecX
MNEYFFSGYRIKSVRQQHGGLECVIQLENEKFTITAADYRRIGEGVLVANTVIDEEIYADLEFSSEKLSCIQKSLKHLEYGAMTERKLRMKLRGKFSQEAIDAAIEILKQNGYIDDLHLAFDFCQEYFVGRRMSPSMIKAKLYNRGFDRDTVSVVFEEYDFSDEIIRENIKFLVLHKFGENLSDEQKRKALGYLIRQGYSYEDSKSCLEMDY